MVRVILVVVAAVPIHRAQAFGGPENVAVVINADSWASKTIANEFIHLRRIPPINVIALTDVPGFDTINIDAFRQRILKPVLTAIEDRGLSKQIDYVVYSSDFPYAIDARADLAGKKTSRILSPIGSINGLTYLYEQTLAGDVGYLQLNSNDYMRRPLHGRRSKPVGEEDKQRYAKATQLMAKKDWAAAETLMSQLVRTYAEQSVFHYNLACCLSRQGKSGEAIAALNNAVAAGFSNAKHAQTDADLESLREQKGFLELLKKVEQKGRELFDVQPTQAFRNRYRWNRRGEKYRVARPASVCHWGCGGENRRL
jgi:hypothetical protein